MFFPNTRYANAGTYLVRDRGRTVVAVRFPVPRHPVVRGFHPRTDALRLDAIAAYYLGDATAFWQLCDASGALAPDALTARGLVAIPKTDR